MKLYCIIANRNKPYNKECFEYLEQACKDRGVEFVAIESDYFDYSQDLKAAIETPSLLYRLSTSTSAAMLEALLVREGVTTLYQEEQIKFMRGFSWSGAIRMQAAGLPIIPTVFNVTKEQDPNLAKYVDSLGGFPVILKASGGSHGSSVLRIDSLESLRSVLGFVTTRTDGHFVLRKYIDNATHLRFVVVGDKVADAIRYLPQPDDFRTNAVEVPQVEAFHNADETRHLFDLAVQAVSVQKLEFGGVDLLLDTEGNAFIAEVNYPCNFARNQMNTNIDVAGIIVDYLLAKSGK